MTLLRRSFKDAIEAVSIYSQQETETLNAAIGLEKRYRHTAWLDKVNEIC